MSGFLIFFSLLSHIAPRQIPMMTFMATLVIFTIHTCSRGPEESVSHPFTHGIAMGTAQQTVGIKPLWTPAAIKPCSSTERSFLIPQPVRFPAVLKKKNHVEPCCKHN